MLSAGKFNTEQIWKSQIISLYTQICVGEIKTVRNCLQLKKDQNNTRLGKYNAGQI